MPLNHSFDMHLCRYDVKMDVGLRNKISAVFYRISKGTGHIAVGFMFEMSCTVHVMFLNAFLALSLSLKTVLNLLPSSVAL